MKLLIERYSYDEHGPGSPVYNAMHGSGLIPDIELDGKLPVSLDYVGYLYNRECDDVVFVLPKVVLTGEKAIDETGTKRVETVFGITPEELVDFDRSSKKEDKAIKGFLSELAIWIYRTLCIYREHNPDSNVLQSAEYSNNSRGKKANKLYTLFDVVLALRDFNRENQNYLTFVAKYNHSGQNKIQWTKTISRSQAVIQDEIPIYLNPINKKKEVNYDEELLIIYYSILNHIKDQYGFQLSINVNYPLISGPQFKSYCVNGKGIRRLKAIKYKYFSDKSLRLWNLCYAFFDQCHDITIKKKTQDYLLVRSFQIVFERMIDELLGDQITEKGLKNQRDNKRVDHMFVFDSLMKADVDQQKYNTYYISDSKYYSRREIAEARKVEKELLEKTPISTGIRLDDTSIYKQFTYARNVIQWNMNLFFQEPNSKHLQLRPDPLTEGYNVIPNFFISAFIPQSDDDNKRPSFDFKNDYLMPHETVEFNRHFDNRLFDRDTLLLSYYDVNFLFVVSLYGRNNKFNQACWRTEVKKAFRDKVQEKLDALYDFYLLRPKEFGWEDYIKSHFHELNGKVYRPDENCDYIILALLKNDATSKGLLKGFSVDFEKESQISNTVKGELKDFFEMAALPSIKDLSTANVSPLTINTTTVEAGEIDSEPVIVAYYKDQKHLEWILKKHLYNLRAGDDPGSMIMNKELIGARYIMLHNGQVSSHFIKLVKGGPKVYLRQQLLKEGYPIYMKTDASGITVDYERETKDANRIYLVYSLDKSNSSEDVFQHYKWQIKELLRGRPEKKPFTISVGELMNKAIDK